MQPKDFNIDDDWYTPKYVVDKFGQFDYDPATNEQKAKEFSIKEFDTIETNGLNRDWTQFKRIWVNPPFTRKNEFLSKAVDCYEKTHNDIYFVLPIQFLTTKSFHKIVHGATIYLPNGRIKFEKFGSEYATSPAFGSVIIQLNDKWELKILKI